MRSIRWIFFLFLPVVALITLSGCSKGYRYPLTCIVRNATDGKPLEGVSVVVDTSGNRDDLTYGDPVPDESDAEGRFRYEIYEPMGSPAFRSPHWYLKLEKDGFTPEVVDIKPGPEPKDAGTVTPIFIVVYMRQRSDK